MTSYSDSAGSYLCHLEYAKGMPWPPYQAWIFMLKRVAPLRCVMNVLRLCPLHWNGIWTGNQFFPIDFSSTPTSYSYSAVSCLVLRLPFRILLGHILISPPGMGPHVKSFLKRCSFIPPMERPHFSIGWWILFAGRTVPAALRAASAITWDNNNMTATHRQHCITILQPFENRACYARCGLGNQVSPPISPNFGF